MTGCVEALEEKTSDYGYIQLKIVKAPEASSQTLSKAGENSAGNQLEYLSDASKIRLSLRDSDGNVQQPTLTLEPAAGDQSEWGMWTEKLQLYTGDYRLLSYEILGNVDQDLLQGSPSSEFNISVIPGGLVVKDLEVNARLRGNAEFEFVKVLPATKAVGVQYRFENVYKADVAVQNVNTNEVTEFSKMTVTTEYFYTEPQEGEDYHVSSKLVADTLVNLAAGEYRILNFGMYNRSGKPLEGDDVPDASADNRFTVSDNTLTTVKVPVTFTESSPQVKDGMILKKLWEALDGPNWRYTGRYHNKGCNWDFSRDVDLWVAQPGVTILDDGRVASINFSMFGAKGAIPEEISGLEMLKGLTLGQHDDLLGDTPQTPEEDLTTADTETLRASFKAFAHPECGLSALSTEMREILPEDKLAQVEECDRRMAAREAATKASATPDGHFSSYITSLPESIGELKNLTRIFIANSPIEKLPESLENLTSLTDMEIYNCPKMKEFPTVITRIPNLQMLYFGRNTGLDAEQMYAGLASFNDNEQTNPSVQGLYMMDNNLETIPDMSNMKKLGLLDLSNNKISAIEAPFGKEINFATLDLSGNLLEDGDIPVDGEGYFAGYEGVESWSFAGNRLTVLPNIFDGSSPFYMGSVDFSSNRISKIEGAEDGTYKGVNVETFNLGFNRFTEFPEALYGSGSKISYLILKGNGIRTISEKALEGEYTYSTISMDLGMNRIKELPDNFHNRTFPYMYGLDLSWNAFDAFPWIVTDLSGVQVFIFRGQRDDNGYRCMKEWPVGLYGWKSLNTIYLGSNDIGKVTDGTLERIRFSFEITDNPRLSIDLSPLSPYISAGLVSVLFDPGQNVQGL